MARKRMVTRTIKTTSAEVLKVNLENAETFKETVVVSGVFKDNKSLLKVISKNDPENMKTVAIINTTVSDKLYGMEEAKFLLLAEEITR